MTIALSASETWEYVTEQDRELPEDGQTRWTLGRLSIEDEAWVTDQASETGRIPLGTAALRLLRKYLRGASNFCDANGEEVKLEFRAGLLTDESLRRIPRNTRIELTRELMTTASLSEADVGKSGPPST